MEHYLRGRPLRPGWADAHNNLGVALPALRVTARGGGAPLPGVLWADPRHAEARNNLGVALADKGRHRRGRRPPTARCCGCGPTPPRPTTTSASCWSSRASVAEAVACYRRALELRPDYARGPQQPRQRPAPAGRLDEAEASLPQALRLKPDYAEAYNNLAIVLVKQERLDEAVASYRQALRLKPDYPEPTRTWPWPCSARATSSDGWPEYEWRWRCTRASPARAFAQPRWDGSPLDGRTILLLRRAGAGRHPPVHPLRRRWSRSAAARVVVECQPALLPPAGALPRRSIAWCPRASRCPPSTSTRRC